MAVSYANSSMNWFENNMLSEYQKLYNKKPNTWLRFIDDIFFVWSGDEKSLKHFLTFCNNFSNEYKLKSSIKFTYTYSEKEVNFIIRICM